ncbi:MAG: tetratricopeptide repeat protein [Bacteroidales bacterium]|nr:tetratricopeptide repeat protein [Bacteroidales bacterium]MBP3254710.1 tetratricopeptide repeat protein [Bacteroidales bacterium]
MKRSLFTITVVALVLLCSCSSGRKSAKTDTNKEDFVINSMMIDAVTALDNADFQKAENLYQQILTKDRNNAAALYYLSSLAFQQQDLAKSIDYGKQAIKNNDTNIWYKLQLAEIFLSSQNYDEAAAVMEKVVKQQPEVLEYWQQLESIYHVKNDFKGEIATLDKMEKRFGVNEMTSMIKYNLYKEKGDNLKAEQQIINLTKAYPSQSKYWSILAEMKMKEKKYDKAFEYYKKVEELDPENDLLNFTYANYYLVKQNDDSLYYYLKKAVSQEEIDFQTKINILFTVYQDKVDTDTVAFRRFFSLLETMRSTSDTSSCQLWSMLNLGYMRQQNFLQGAYSAQKAVELGCNNFDLYTNWLYALSTFAPSEVIIQTADQAIETYPEQPLPYLFKGVNQELLHDYENAVQTLTIGLNRTGKDKEMKEDFYMNLGDCYHALGNKEECYKNYEQVLLLNPDNYAVLNNYAYYLSLDKKDLNTALEYSRKAAEKYPDNLNFVDTYAWVLYQLGRYNEAKNVLENVISLRQQWSETLENHYKEILNKL